MDWKLLLFFIVAFLTLLYFSLFWKNRYEKISLHFFKDKVDVSLGLLMLAVFLDGALIAALLLWLLGLI